MFVCFLFDELMNLNKFSRRLLDNATYQIPNVLCLVV